MAPSQFRAFLCRVLPVAALVAVCMVASTIAATLAILGVGSAVLEASVSSRVPVDYSADQVALKIPRLSPEIIDAIRRDRDASAIDSGASGGPASQTPSPGVIITPAPSRGATPPPNTEAPSTPTPVIPLPSPIPTLPVTTPTPPPLPTLPPTPTLPVIPTLPALPTLPLTPTLPPLP
jgi:hypothetical protein